MSCVFSSTFSADRIDVQDPDLMDGCSVTWMVGALIAAEYSDRRAWYEGDHPGYHPVDNQESSVMTTGGSTTVITVLLIMVQVVVRLLKD